MCRVPESASYIDALPRPVHIRVRIQEVPLHTVVYAGAPGAGIAFTLTERVPGDERSSDEVAGE